MTWCCPTCGSKDHPEEFRLLREHFDGLTPREQGVARALLLRRRKWPPTEIPGTSVTFDDYITVLFDDLVYEVEGLGGDPCKILELFEEEHNE